MLDLRIKKLFFDRQKVIRAVGRATREALSKAGAFIRQTAKTSIRKRQGPAPPGQPPHSHVGLVRKFILFGYEPGPQAVVVGPARLSRSTDAPHTLEFGGSPGGQQRGLRIGDFAAVKVEPGGKIRRTIIRTRAQLERAKKLEAQRSRARIAPRPFMGPALEKEKPKLPKRWANSIRGG